MPSEFTTFHAVRDLPVAPTWQTAPDFAGKLDPMWEGTAIRRPSTVTEFDVQFLAIIILLIVNMRLIKDIVKHLFIKIEIALRVFHAVSRIEVRAACRFGAAKPREIARSLDSGARQPHS